MRLRLPFLGLFFGLLTSPVSAKEPERITVAVVPLSGPNAPLFNDALIQELRSVPSVTVLDLRALAALIGPVPAKALARCQADTCRVEALQALQWDEVLVGELGQAGVEARLLNREGATKLKASVEAELTPDLLAQRLVRSLYTERAQGRAVSVRLVGLPPEAFVRWADRAPELADALWRLEVAPGLYEVEIRAKGYNPWTQSVEVLPGREQEVRVSMSQRRSDLPYWVGGAGLLVAAGGAGLWALGESRVSDWNAACDPICQSGFTLERYQGDQDALEREQVVGGVLLSVGTAALLSAIVWYILEPGQPGPNQSFP